MSVHLEGMGVIGCYLAWRLWADDRDFTWSDSDERITAWRACTGAIFPTGHDEDMEALNVWRGHLNESGFAEHMEEAAYVFTQKTPPHGGSYTPFRVDERVQRAPMTSLHLNAQTWVQRTRRTFAGLRDERRAGELRVVTHGFGARLDRFMWGWTVPVRLGFEPEVYERGPGIIRPCVYCREGRYVMAYAYPIPGTDMWYAGSSLISQRVPKELDVKDKYRRWRDDFLRMTDGYVTGVVRAGMPVQGWRPVPAAGDTAWLTAVPGAVLARPLWHSGVRHAPHVYNELRRVLG